MPFELEEPTKAKITDVEVLSSKDRKPNENPGAAVNITAVLSNEALTMFDPFMRGNLYQKVDKAPAPEKAQGALVPEVSNAQITSDMPKLTTFGIGLGEFSWPLEMVGCILDIEYGTKGPSGIRALGWKVHKFRIFPQEGGSVIIKCRIEFGDVDGETHGRLAMLKNCDAVLTLLAPNAADTEPDTNPLPFNTDGSSTADTPEAALTRANAET
ncbi:hypothetical protein D9M73_77790 [compost metagenome]